MADLLFAREDGQWFDFPPLGMAGAAGSHLIQPVKPDLIPLPEGATLTMMPQLAPVGIDKENGEFLLLDYNPYKKKKERIYAVAALLPQGFSRLLCPGVEDSDAVLPLLGYTAVGVENGKLVVAAKQTDEHKRWHPRYFNTPELAAKVEARKKEFPDNRIIRQLAHCSLEYGCFTAQNIFYRRWEGGIPASPVCNADCLGCISLQPSECCPSPQQRIDFTPTAGEMTEIAVAHLRQAEDGIISFGQGCEGEPSLNYPAISQALPEIRRQTKRGLLNINTNAGNTEAIEALLEAGMDSFRVSIFSPIEAEYAAYHRPCGYGLPQVVASLKKIAAAGRPAALNLLAYPGFTDDSRRLDALVELAREGQVKQIQIRNLNCGPALMKPFVADSWGMGMRQYIGRLQDLLPQVQIGNYTHSKQGNKGASGKNASGK